MSSANKAYERMTFVASHCGSLTNKSSRSLLIWCKSQISGSSSHIRMRYLAVEMMPRSAEGLATARG